VDKLEGRWTDGDKMNGWVDVDELEGRWTDELMDDGQKMDELMNGQKIENGGRRWQIEGQKDG